MYALFSHSYLTHHLLSKQFQHAFTFVLHNPLTNLYMCFYDVVGHSDACDLMFFPMVSSKYKYMDACVGVAGLCQPVVTALLKSHSWRVCAILC